MLCKDLLRKIYFLKNIFLCSLLSFLFGLKVAAQDQNFPGVSPSLSFTASLNSKFDVNVLATSKIRLGEKTIKDEIYAPQVLEIYSQALATYAINRHWHIGAGYGFQRNNPFLNNWRNEHRLVQQAQYVTHFSRSMLYNRFRFEERWFSFPNAVNEFATRVRYQAGFATELSKNAYWQINEEAYFIPSAYRNALFSENWFYSGIGFKLNPIGNIETGIGYNAVARNTNDFTNYLLLQVAWSYTIKSHDNSMMSVIMHNRHF